VLKSVWHNGTVVSKQQLTYQSLCDLGFGSETSQMEDSTIIPIFQVNSSVVYVWSANMILNRAGASTQPCFTPFDTLNVSEKEPWSRTHASMPSYSDLTTLTNFSGYRSFFNTCQKPSRFTVSNAFVRSSTCNLRTLMVASWRSYHRSGGFRKRPKGHIPHSPSSITFCPSVVTESLCMM